MRAFLSTVVFVGSFGLAAPLATQAAESIQVGPQAGDKITANFEARDASGKSVTLTDIAGENGVVISFVRSASWCPFCQQQMKDLNSINAALESRGYSLAALSYDKPEILDQFAKKQSIDYTLLSDEGSKMIDAFDVRDPQYGEDSMAYGVPQPVVIIIAPDGTVQGSLAVEGYRDRPPTEDVLAEVDRILGATS